jgi:cyclopropane-fatty-acyl-phospholipid synthase
MYKAVDLAEKGYLPEWLMRFGMRRLLGKRLKKESSGGEEHQKEILSKFLEAPVAINTDEANEQHYALPPEFMEIALGSRLKYSSGYWPENVHSLDDAEIAALELVAERAQLSNNMSILELGCGWGSFSLWAAERYPDSTIVSISNSPQQRDYIEKKAARLGFKNLKVITADINTFSIKDTFDRVVTIEMLEHVRNHAHVFKQISDWLKPNGRLFVHVFSHRQYAYPFEVDGDNDWMARYFFTGGIMPSHDLFRNYSQHLEIEKDWQLSGIHYQKTLDAWLHKMEMNKPEVLKIFKETYGVDNARIWFHRWRMFFMACSELFGYSKGTEWGVSHYVFRKNAL